jgi:hypothetical protein
MTPMKALPHTHVRQRLFCVALSAAMVVALTIGGCGPSSSDTPQELSPEAKKGLAAAKGTDLSKYAKPKGKGKTGKTR